MISENSFVFAKSESQIHFTRPLTVHLSTQITKKQIIKETFFFFKPFLFIVLLKGLFIKLLKQYHLIRSCTHINILKYENSIAYTLLDFISTFIAVIGLSN